MRRLYGWMTACAVLAGLLWGCGSTGDGTDGNDGLILQAVGFHGDGLAQSDQVRPNSADVDVVENLCMEQGQTGDAPRVTTELLTQTIVNAIFRNHQKQDIRLNQMVVHFDDPRVGFGDLTQSITGTVVGGRCSSAPERACASDADCLIGATRGTCNFGESVVSSLLLIDFAAKAAVQPSVYGLGLPARITFSGFDVNGNHYRATTGYTVTFANFCNCGSEETCCDTLSECLIGQ